MPEESIELLWTHSVREQRIHKAPEELIQPHLYLIGLFAENDVITKSWEANSSCSEA